MTQRALPRSALGKAIAYTGGLWPGLVRFLADPKIPLDTNSVERALRGVAVGRKNHYGSRSERGTRVAALFYSLVESAKICGVEPRGLSAAKPPCEPSGQPGLGHARARSQLTGILRKKSAVDCSSAKRAKMAEDLRYSSDRFGSRP